MIWMVRVIVTSCRPHLTSTCLIRRTLQMDSDCSSCPKSQLGFLNFSYNFPDGIFNALEVMVYLVSIFRILIRIIRGINQIFLLKSFLFHLLVLRPNKTRLTYFQVYILKCIEHERNITTFCKNFRPRNFPLSIFSSTQLKFSLGFGDAHTYIWIINSHRSVINRGSSHPLALCLFGRQFTTMYSIYWRHSRDALVIRDSGHHEESPNMFPKNHKDERKNIFGL